MEKEKKDFQRSIRMTPTTKKILLAADGEGLNQKFENLVYKSFLQKEEVEEEIQRSKEYLERLNQQLNEKQQLIQKLEQAKYHIDKLLEI